MSTLRRRGVDAGGREFVARPLRERSGADLLEQCQRGPQLLARDRSGGVADAAIRRTPGGSERAASVPGNGPVRRAPGSTDASACSSSASSARQRASSPRDIGVSDATARRSRSTERRVGHGSSSGADGGLDHVGECVETQERVVLVVGIRGLDRPPAHCRVRVRAPRSSTRRTAASSRDRAGRRTARPPRPPAGSRPPAPSRPPPTVRRRRSASDRPQRAAETARRSGSWRRRAIPP